MVGYHNEWHPPPRRFLPKRHLWCHGRRSEVQAPEPDAEEKFFHEISEPASAWTKFSPETGDRRERGLRVATTTYNARRAFRQKTPCPRSGPGKNKEGQARQGRPFLQWDAARRPTSFHSLTPTTTRRQSPVK